MARKVSLITDESGIKRCWWCGDDPQYVDYHDNEWGRAVTDDNRLFEKICLEGFQSGLSWITILRKRESFRKAFKGFEIAKVARFNQRHVVKLLEDASIVRHRGKIESTINNAKMALQMQDEFGSLSEFFWSFQPEKKLKFDRNRAITPESTALSKKLKKLGWSFVGPTTCYAFMQAMGMVNDHHPKCHCYAEIEADS
ncbi:MAG: DNA-3-methyladenine glycosylase I [Planctomycetota bacterium]